ncbi:hypothetical protein ACHAWO_004367 [Cyclotella atomus]|uniref:Transcriptional adapter n=1 Tax=Cyclotella atomus TaxID=382360 RepID=A0ABD3MUP8_9STRA
MTKRAKKGNTAASASDAADENDGTNQTNHDEEENPKITPRDPVLLGPSPRGLYECDYCRADLTRSPRVRCATCPDFDLCLDCLATSDHVEMCKSRRDFQRMHRKQTAQQSGKATTEPAPKKRKGRPGRKRVEEEEEEDDPTILGYYHQGQWIPIFRHQATHEYVVADSTRYMLFPPFRGVRSEGGVEKRINLLGEKKDDADAVDVDGLDKKDVNEKTDASNDKDVQVCEDQKPDASTEASNEAKPESSREFKDENMAGSADKVKSSYADETKDGADKADADVEMKGADEPSTVDTAAVKSEEQQDEPSQENVGEHMPAPTKKSTKEQAKKPQFTLAEDLRNLWTIEEDLRLLDGILTCGLGNWPEIAEHVNGGNGDTPTGAVGGKTDKMCMERYLDDFMGRYGHIVPPYTMVPIEEEEKDIDSDVEIVGVSVPTSERKRLRRSYPASEEEDGPGFKKTRFRVVPTAEFERDSSVWRHQFIPNVPGIKRGDEVARDLWYRSEQTFVRQCSNATSQLDVEKIRQEFIEKRAKKIQGYEANVLPPRIEDLKSYPGSEMAGYMPRRQDFDVEHDNDAENLIADMEFAAEDSAADKDLKVEVIKIFNSKLDEREKRKKFILEKKLMNYRENQEQFQKLPADERHLIHRMRLFERFHSSEAHKTFVDNVLKAKRLRKEIAKLQTYRRLGITSLADAEKYELDKSRREYHKMAWLKKEAETKKAEAEAARQAKENASADLGMMGLDGGIGAAANQSLGIWKQYSQDSPSKRRRIDDGAESAADVTAVEQGESQPTESAGTQSETAEVEMKPASDSFALEDKPGFDMLSSKEKELCKRLQLLPQDYLAVKKALISKSLEAGIMGTSQKGKTFVTVDVSKSNDIIDFVLKAGWISSRPAVTSIALKEDS